MLWWIHAVNCFCYLTHRRLITIHPVEVCPLSLRKVKWLLHIFWFKKQKYPIQASIHVCQHTLIQIRSMCMFWTVSVLFLISIQCKYTSYVINAIIIGSDARYFCWFTLSITFAVLPLAFAFAFVLVFVRYLSTRQFFKCVNGISSKYIMWNALGADSICLRVNWIFKSLRWKLLRASEPVYELVDNKSAKKRRKKKY